MQYLRSKSFDILAVLWTLLLSPSLPILWSVNASAKYVRAVSQLWANGLMFLFRTVVNLKYVERGRENIPEGPCIVICNHQSLWETVALSTIFPDASFVAKIEVLQIPIVGWFLAKYPMIALDRSARPSAVRKLLAASASTISEGRKIIIFPEGTRSDANEPVKFKGGVTALYARLGVPALPVALNSGVFWPGRKLMKYDGTITVSYLPRIEPGLDSNEFRVLAERMISDEATKLLKEAQH